MSMNLIRNESFARDMNFFKIFYSVHVFNHDSNMKIDIHCFMIRIVMARFVDLGVCESIYLILQGVEEKVNIS